MVELFDSLSSQTRFAHFCAQFSGILQLPEGTSNVISGWFVGPIVPEKGVKFGCPRLNHSREIPPEAVGSGLIDSFFRCSFRPEVDNNVSSGVAVECVGADVRVKFGDARFKRLNV